MAELDIDPHLAAGAEAFDRRTAPQAEAMPEGDLAGSTRPPPVVVEPRLLLADFVAIGAEPQAPALKRAAAQIAHAILPDGAKAGIVKRVVGAARLIVERRALACRYKAGSAGVGPICGRNSHGVKIPQKRLWAEVISAYDSQLKSVFQ